MDDGNRLIELEELNQKYKLAFEYSKHAILWAGENGIIINCNTEAEKLFLRSRAELIGMHQSKLHPAKKHNAIVSEFTQALKYGNMFPELETEIIDSRGLEKKVIITTSVIELKNGKMIQGVFRDITEQKKIQQDLLESELKFKTIFNKANDGIIIADAVTKKFVDCNDAACKMLGYSKKELLTLKVDDIHPAESLSFVINQFERQVQNEIQIAERLSVLKKNGEIILADINSNSFEMNEKKYLMGIFRDSTENYKNRELLEKQQLRFKTIMDNFNELVYVSDIQTNEILFFNKRGIDLFGDNTGKTCWKVIQSNQTGPCSFCSNKKLIDSNGKHTGVYVWEFQNTITKKWYECRDQAIYWFDGRTVRMEIAIDITDRKAAEDAARESSVLYNQMFTDHSAVMLLIDFETKKIMQANPAAVKFYGYPLETLLNKKMTEINTINGDELHLEMSKAITKTSNYFKFRHRLASGEIKDVEVYSVPLQFQKKNCLYSIIHDITDRCKAEKAIVKQLAYIKMLANLNTFALSAKSITEIMINCVNMLGTTLEVSRVYIFEYNKTEETLSNTFEWIARGISERKDKLQNIPAKNLNYLPMLMQKEIIFINDSKKIIEKDLMKKIENYNIKSFALVPLFVDGSFFGVLGLEESYITRNWDQDDVNILQSAAGAISSSLEKFHIQKQLIHSEKLSAVGQLAAGIAHEFNNIMTIIYSNAQLIEMLRFKITPEKINEYSQRINRSVIRGKKIVSYMMSMSRPKELKKELIDLNNIMDNVLALQKEQLNLENITIVQNCGETSTKISADKGQIEQVMLNMIINSRHAMKSKGGGIITTGSFIDGNYYRYYIKDTGCGMSKEIMKNIFTPFFTTKGAYAKDKFGIQGTGLGLSVSFMILQNHNGWIEVESDEGKGSTFTLIFPIYDSGKPESVNSDIMSEKNDIIPDSHLKTILIVDDEIEILELTSEFLQISGYNALTASTGKNALEIVKSKKIDAIFLDMLMPEMNGEMIYSEIRKINISVPVIFVSGQIEIESNKFIEQGITDFIQKPYSFNKMINILKKI